MSDIEITDAQKSVVIYLISKGFLKKIAVKIVQELKIKNSDEFAQLTDTQINNLTTIKLWHKDELIRARNIYREKLNNRVPI